MVNVDAYKRQAAAAALDLVRPGMHVGLGTGSTCARFLELLGGPPPVPTLVAVWPLRSLKMALRLHHEVPGIIVPEDLLAALEAAGPEAARVGRERALELFREAPAWASGAYLIAPFKQPEEVIPLIDEAMM